MVKLRQNIFLDLDQTIISGEEVESFNYKKYGKKLSKFNYHTMDEYYYIVERPGLQQFLDYLFENFNVSIWTAASKDYALFIIKNIILRNKRNRKIDFVFFSYHCDISHRLTGYTKKLSITNSFFKLEGYDYYNTFILDDYDEVYKSQVYNCIRAKPFYFYDKGSEYDHFLMDMIYYLEKLRKIGIEYSKANNSINNEIRDEKVKEVINYINKKNKLIVG